MKINSNKKMSLKIALISVLVLVALILGTLFFYLPRYLTKDVIVNPTAKEGEELTIMSTNVRCYSPTDFLKKSWFYRAELIATDIASVMPDVICFQEMNAIHYAYLQDVMQGYSSLMTYRDKSLMKEGCSIFYRTDRFEEIESGHFWLSETPDVMSKDWGSAHYRICVYVCLKDLNTGKEFIVFNTHLDHKSEEARIKGIEVVLDKIAELDGRPAYLIGDLNAQENSKTIKSTHENFDDAQKIASITENTATYHNWGDSSYAKRIDYILISTGDATVSEYHVVDNCYSGVYSSDHSSIYIKTKIN
ncbi:MAG: endonuclease/exonuclease/phosphatase family protein [Ruminococcaceae bacterium]|nr:endonuclease/exonuclease/phosphatase family protein [Oscillospiraceae bacterium]